MFFSDSGITSVYELEVSQDSNIDDIINSKIFEQCDYKDVGYPKEVIAFPLIEDEEKSISIRATFFNSKLIQVKMYDGSSKFGDDDWEPEVELARKLSNEEWFYANSNAKFQSYSWGKVESICDEEYGYAMIIISYSD